MRHAPCAVRRAPCAMPVVGEEERHAHSCRTRGVVQGSGGSARVRYQLPRVAVERGRSLIRLTVRVCRVLCVWCFVVLYEVVNLVVMAN